MIVSNNEIVAIEKLKSESSYYISQLVEVFDILDKLSNVSNIEWVTQILINELENEEENKDYEEMDGDLKIKLLELKFDIKQLQLMESNMIIIYTSHVQFRHSPPASFLFH